MSRAHFQARTSTLPLLARLMGEAARTLRLWQVRRQARRDLGELDERLLKDIGLDRSEIERAVYYGRFDE